MPELQFTPRATRLQDSSLFCPVCALVEHVQCVGTAGKPVENERKVPTPDLHAGLWLGMWMKLEVRWLGLCRSRFFSPHFGYFAFRIFFFFPVY